ncbi:MAG: phosphate:acyl-[acyl carrier protein] acyltransferase [Candidatus Acidoferrum typicum]|jgi:glycerol-3-phosphate acyltransferase PlsX|nr:phosphate:acyl-[acyl carrier protein] acyltransferase [Candidatus Acidoferrum typicum]
MITIAVDAMGGDHAPRPEVEGAVVAAREFGVRILLVGLAPELKRELAKHAHRGLPIEIVPASEVITMHDSPSQAFRKKKDSSAHVAAKLVRDGLADGFISAGNTGAVMAVARFGLGTLSSVDRAALAAPFPTARGGTSVMLDVGANVDSKPAHLVQFAVMGEIYYRAIFGTRRPKVALLSIGEEEMKGNELTREAHIRLKQSTLNFVGNVEGREIFGGAVDVIVCDGFIGNVALKISEGVAQHIVGLLKDALQSTLSSQVGYVLSKKAYRNFRKKIDYSEYGGAPLLGVRGVTVIGHGSSNAHAIKNAIRVATELVRGGVNERIEQELSMLPVAVEA